MSWNFSHDNCRLSSALRMPLHVCMGELSGVHGRAVKPAFRMPSEACFTAPAAGAPSAQADFRGWAFAFMAAVFALTTPIGIAIGIGIEASFNENSLQNLVVSGVFDSISTGVCHRRAPANSTKWPTPRQRAPRVLCMHAQCVFPSMAMHFSSGTIVIMLQPLLHGNQGSVMAWPHICKHLPRLCLPGGSAGALQGKLEPPRPEL